MSIETQLEELNQIKTNIFTSIGNKGVVVPENLGLKDAAGLIDQIEGGGGVDLPEEYQKLLYVYINGTGNPQISSNSWVYRYGMPSFTFEDKIDVLTEIKVNTELDGDIELGVITRDQPLANRSFLFRQIKNTYGIDYRFDVRLMGTYNGLDTTFTNSDESKTNGFYNTGSGATETGLYVELNGERRTGIGNKDATANLGIFITSNYGAYNGTKLFYIKIGNKVNLIPCKRISDEQIGLFCTINNKFIYPDVLATSWSGGIPI